MSAENKWKRTKTKKLLKHPRLNVYEDDVVLPNGVSTSYLHFGEQLDSVVIIPLDGNCRVLLQREYSYPPNEWLFQFPGGALDPGEAPTEGAARELSEEANIEGRLRQIGWFYPDYRRKKEKQYVFVATKIKPKFGESDPEEVFDHQWRTEEEIDSMIKNNQIPTFNALAAWAFYKIDRIN